MRTYNDDDGGGGIYFFWRAKPTAPPSVDRPNRQQQPWSHRPRAI